MTVSAAPAQPTSLTSSVTSGCSSVTTNITLNGPTSGFTYQLINANTKATIGSPVTASSTSAITLASGIKIYATTTFGVLITPNTANACTSESDKTVTVTVTEGPSFTQAVTIDKPTPCSGEQVTISVKTEYNSGYTYVIKDDLNNTIGTSFTGTGSVISRTTTYAGGVTEKRTFRVEVTGGCATNMALATTVTATPTTAAVTANAGPAQEVCGTVTLDGNYASPGVGTWTKTAGPEGGSITNVNDPKTTVTGLPSGVHEFTWTMVTSCGTTNTSSQNKVQITINCPAQYIVMAPKYASQYRSGEILASASDTDNGIKAAMVVAGTLPSWAELLTNGNVVVKPDATPVAGTYTLTSRTTDNFNRTTDTPLSLTVYDTEPAITPLPVELVYFTASTQNGRVNLKWLTASEKDNKEFVVERSADGKTFKGIGTVKGSGNSSTPIRYSFTDKSLLPGRVYYRLKQVDHNEKFSYSKLVTVSAEVVTLDMQLQVYPNPFSSELYITVTALQAGSCTLQLLDLQGCVVHAGEVELHPGLNELNLSLPYVRNGMYVLRLIGSGINRTVKVLKN